jgi:hypothetical protein
VSGFPILDLVVGIIFIYFLLSIICSSAVELWLSIRKTRARMLERWLKLIFNSQAHDSHGAPLVGKDGQPVSVGQAIMDHCMVTVLSKSGRSTSYIDAKDFISALLDKITIQPNLATDASVQLPPASLDDYIRAIERSQAISGELKRTILMYANEAKVAAAAVKNIPVTANISNNISAVIKSDFDHFRDRMERWYDSNADRLTGAMKRTKVLPKTVIVATIITIALNVDSVEVSRYLYQHKDESKEFANYALQSLDTYKTRMEKMKTGSTDSMTDSNAVATLNRNLSQVRQDVDSLHAALPSALPLGWKGKHDNWTDHIFGWLATILAICVGAPFWFDILNKISNLRGSGPKPATAEDKTAK